MNLQCNCVGYSGRDRQPDFVSTGLLTPRPASAGSRKYALDWDDSLSAGPKAAPAHVASAGLETDAQAASGIGVSNSHSSSDSWRNAPQRRGPNWTSEGRTSLIRYRRVKLSAPIGSLRRSGFAQARGTSSPIRFRRRPSCRETA